MAGTSRALLPQHALKRRAPGTPASKPTQTQPTSSQQLTDNETSPQMTRI
jgi:hypothetical protein